MLTGSTSQATRQLSEQVALSRSDVPGAGRLKEKEAGRLPAARRRNLRKLPLKVRHVQVSASLRSNQPSTTSETKKCFSTVG
jgi:hypothetical protein